MTASYRKIDYRMRPAKYVERLMLCDAFRRLTFSTVESYQYVGLGSVYFSDFALFHRALGIQRMVSIERATFDKQRFVDNRPFANIEMRWGDTSSELIEVNLSLRTIAWLDYDGRLSRPVIDDVRSFTSRCTSGCVLVISVQCMPNAVEGSFEGSPREQVDKLAEELGSERIDPSYDDRALLGWGTAQVFREVIINEIAEVLESVNAVRPALQQMQFEQIINFHYKDGAHMMTVGGVFFDRGQRPLFDQCAFKELDFVRTGREAFRIEIPKLTGRELQLLEAQIPLIEDAVLQYGSMPQSDANQFVRIYRYFPNFKVVDL